MGDAKDKAAEKATEQITLSRSQLWLLQIAAATGVLSMISHLVELIGHLTK